MKEIGGSLTSGEVFAGIAALLDRHNCDRSGVDAATWLEWVTLARRVRQRVDAACDLLIAEAERVQAAERAKGTPLASWLGTQEVLSRKEAKNAVFRAKRLAEHPKVAEKVAAGSLGDGQARAIGKVLDDLAPQLNPAQHNQAEQVLLGLSGHLDADQLAQAAPQVLQAVAPVDADELLERKLQREAEAAYRQRSLRFFKEGGSIRFDGSLPIVEGERFITLIDARSEKLRRTAIEARDRLAVRPTTEQRRADALIGLLEAAATGKPEPGVGTAKVLVILDHDKLRAGAAGAGLIGGQPISAGELRRICCDAEIIPAVLGAGSEVLDVGRANRYVTPAILNALILRDGGCAFPGCNTPTQLCEAHHIIPWWNGGPTALWNLVLLCHHHHALCEPARYNTRDQWQIRIADGLPEFLPPARLDPQRTPIPNTRCQTGNRAEAAEAAGVDEVPEVLATAEVATAPAPIRAGRSSDRDDPANGNPDQADLFADTS